MNNTYGDTKNEISESMALEFFQKHNMPAKKFNTIDYSDVDLLVYDSRVDVQYSENFQKYGDLRVDFVSAYDSPKIAKSLNADSDDIFSKFETDENVSIRKKGKHFIPDYLDYLIVFFYNNKLNIDLFDDSVPTLDQETIKPDYTLLIKSIDLKEFVINRKKNTIIKNNKYGLTDSHGSAFIPVSVNELVKNLDCLFFENLNIDSSKIHSFLNN